MMMFESTYLGHESFRFSLPVSIFIDQEGETAKHPVIANGSSVAEGSLH